MKTQVEILERIAKIDKMVAEDHLEATTIAQLLMARGTLLWVLEPSIAEK